MLGAPALAARAALRSGCGRVRVLAPGAIVDSVVALCPSATGRVLGEDAVGDFDRSAEAAASIVIGPGMGIGARSESLVLRAVQRAGVSVVVDADGIEALAGIGDLARDIRCRLIVTPHPGEFRRLAGPLRIPRDPTSESDRRAGAEAMAQKLGAIVVLKGAGTVVTDGHNTWVCGVRHPVLATAGTGDVLAGLIAGLLASVPAVPTRTIPPAADVASQREKGKHEALSKEELMALAAARLGKQSRVETAGPSEGSGKSGPSTIRLVCTAVEAHARAGVAWADGHKASGGMLAEELADGLPGVLEAMRA
jgi:NAD(P)H-hydrate epimerase